MSDSSPEHPLFALLREPKPGLTAGYAILEWQRTFKRGLDGEPYPDDDLFPHPERHLAYEIGRFLREGMERLETEPQPADAADVVNEVGMQYARYLQAMADAVGCTRDQAAGIIARLSQAGFVWEEIER